MIANCRGHLRIRQRALHFLLQQLGFGRSTVGIARFHRAVLVDEREKHDQRFLLPRFPEQVLINPVNNRVRRLAD